MLCIALCCSAMPSPPCPVLYPAHSSPYLTVQFQSCPPPKDLISVVCTAYKKNGGSHPNCTKVVSEKETMVVSSEYNEF